MNVLSNPLDSKNALPFVRFAPGNGWSISDSSIKGCHRETLDEAVKDWNATIRRKRKTYMNVANVTLAETPVSELPGWGDAIHTERQSRMEKDLNEGNYRDPATGETGKAERAKRKPSSILALVAMLAMGGFLDDEENDSPAYLDGPPSDEMRDLLEASSVFVKCAHGNAMLAVPRSLGDQWQKQFIAHMKNDNVPAVRVMLESAGLMK